MRLRGLPTKKYDISGAGELVKSESGWRLRGELVQLAFSRDAAEWAAVSEGPNRPELKSPTAAVGSPTGSEQQVNDQDTSTQVSPCVEAKMVAWDKQHSSEVDQAAAAARAAGEEFRSSAGMEELVRNEAIAAATSECK